MRIKQYLENPIGKGSAFFPIKDVAKKMDDRYLQNKDNIKHKVYLVRNKIFIHVKVPSHIEGIYYDVILNFIPNKESGNVTILDMDFKVFSNCPSFVFTYVYAYYHHGLVLEDIQKRITKQAISEPANIRNPFGVTGYEYSVYLALKYLLDKKLVNIADLSRRATKSLTLVDLLSNIQNFDSLMKRRKAKENQLKEKAKHQKIKEQKHARREMKFSNVTQKETEKPSVSDVTNSRTTKRVGTTKKTKSIKKK